MQNTMLLKKLRDVGIENFKIEIVIMQESSMNRNWIYQCLHSNVKIKNQSMGGNKYKLVAQSEADPPGKFCRFSNRKGLLGKSREVAKFKFPRIA